MRIGIPQGVTDRRIRGLADERGVCDFSLARGWSLRGGKDKKGREPRVPDMHQPSVRS